MQAIGVVAVAAGLEVLTAGLLLVAPGMFARLLLGTELTDGGATLGRLAGLSLIGLAAACWPGKTSPRESRQPAFALMLFSLLCAVFLAYLGFAGRAGGVLLWPAAATHTVLGSLILLRLSGQRGA